MSATFIKIFLSFACFAISALVVLLSFTAAITKSNPSRSEGSNDLVISFALGKFIANAFSSGNMLFAMSVTLRLWIAVQHRLNFFKTNGTAANNKHAQLCPALEKPETSYCLMWTRCSFLFYLFILPAKISIQRVEKEILHLTTTSPITITAGVPILVSSANPHNRIYRTKGNFSPLTKSHSG